MTGAFWGPWAAALLLWTPGAPEPGAEATPTTPTAGRVRLSGSVSGSRLRVALVDPDEQVGRVQAAALTPMGPRLLPRLDTSVADRLEFELDPSLGPASPIRIEAYAVDGDPPQVLLSIELQPSLELPTAPAPRSVTEPPIQEAAAAELPWWLVAGAVLTAALVGAAVYQELDAAGP